MTPWYKCIFNAPNRVYRADCLPVFCRSAGWTGAKLQKRFGAKPAATGNPRRRTSRVGRARSGHGVAAAGAEDRKTEREIGDVVCEAGTLSARIHGRVGRAQEMAHREVATFPFAPSMREKLLRAGFRTLRDILELTPVQLSQGACVTPAPRSKAWSTRLTVARPRFSTVLSCRQSWTAPWTRRSRCCRLRSKPTGSRCLRAYRRLSCCSARSSRRAFAPAAPTWTISCTAASPRPSSPSFAAPRAWARRSWGASRASPSLCTSA